MPMPIANSISKYAREIGTLRRRRAKSNPEIPSRRYSPQSGSSRAHEISSIIIMSVRGVSAISVRYAAAITATNVR